MSCMFRALFLTLLPLLVSPLLQVARCQSETKNITETVEEVGRLGFGEDVRDYGVDEEFSPAPGVTAVHVFPNNSARLITAGKENELLVVLKNDGEATLNAFAIKASVHLSHDHRLPVQKFPMQPLRNASVPVSTWAAFRYVFAASKYLQPGTFDLVCAIIYEIDQRPYQSTFYNGTIEVTKAAGSMLSTKSVFLLTFGIALLVLAGVWIFGQVQNKSKKN